MSPTDKPQTLYEIEKIAILSALRRHNNNRTKAAEELQITSRTLRNKLHEYGLMGGSEAAATLAEAGEDD